MSDESFSSESAATPRAWRGVRAVLERGVADGVFPGASVLVGSGSAVLFEAQAGVFGHRLLHELDSGAADADATAANPAHTIPPEQPVSADTVYDLASLTKPLVTALLVYQAIGRGLVRWETPLTELLPEFTEGGPDPRRQQVSVERLLGHAGGFPAHRRFFESIGEAGLAGDALEQMADLVAREPLENEPGDVAVYTDLGFILLGRMLERLHGVGLAELFERDVLRPLALTEPMFADPVATRGGADRPAGLWPRLTRTAPAGRCLWRGRVIHGAVQDENTHAMGGVAGHAGLFGTARGVHRIAAALVEASGDLAATRADTPGICNSDVLGHAWATSAAPETTWRLGWDSPTPGASSAGARVGSAAVGHLGYTGTSLWIDRERKVHVVLLTNRVHPDRRNEAIRQFRPAFHDAVFSALEEC